MFELPFLLKIYIFLWLEKVGPNKHISLYLKREPEGKYNVEKLLKPLKLPEINLTVQPHAWLKEELPDKEVNAEKLLESPRFLEWEYLGVGSAYQRRSNQYYTEIF